MAFVVEDCLKNEKKMYTLILCCSRCYPSFLKKGKCLITLNVITQSVLYLKISHDVLYKYSVHS